jgi:hypothetical protein
MWPGRINAYRNAKQRHGKMADQFGEIQELSLQKHERNLSKKRFVDVQNVVRAHILIRQDVRAEAWLNENWRKRSMIAIFWQQDINAWYEQHNIVRQRQPEASRITHRPLGSKSKST